MLAQNFKSPPDLGLSDEAFSAFVKVLGMMERKEIPEHLFTMLHVGEPELDRDCGTPGCILGWARYVSPRLKDQFWAPLPDQPAYNLCFPDMGKITDDFRFLSGYFATRDQAASALRNFLTYGEPRWAEVLS